MVKRILVVDDEVLMLRAYENVLKKADLVVDMATTIEDAEAFLRREEYDVVITDLRLTGVLGMEGLEILRYVRQINPKTRVILITGYGNFEIMNEAYQLGAAYYFEKPISRKTLTSALSSLDIL